MDSGLLKQYLIGNVEGLLIDESFLLYTSILIEVPIAMVLLSKILTKNSNCRINIIAGTIKTLAMIATLFMGNVTKYYLFFAVIEITTTIFIIWYAAQWLRQKEVIAA